MKKISTIILLCLFFWVDVVVAETGSGPATTLDELLQRVVEQKDAESLVNEKRLEKFKRAKDQQVNLLKTAMRENHDLEKKSDVLNADITSNELLLVDLENQLAKRLGNFGELFGVTRQVAGDTRAQIQQSLISAELPGRASSMDDITSSKELPTMDQLRNLWIVLLQEQTEQGKIRRFSTMLNNKQGFAETHDVVRVGPFSAVSEEGFLVYDSDTEQFSQLPRQPSSRYTKAASEVFDTSDGSLINAVIDPSRGAILGLLVKTPSLLERFHQGGLPGYVVSVLALVGLSIGFYRLVILWWVGKKVRRQISVVIARVDNPLGRILKVYEESPKLALDALELKLEDAVLKEIPKLDRGLSTLKVLAAVAPLIGLLGTVVGMILTFQAITLWGTGEPKIMAGGISQALVTTVQGLIAAIPLLLLHSFTNGQARLLQNTLEEQSAGIIAQRAEARYE